MFYFGSPEWEFLLGSYVAETFGLWRPNRCVMLLSVTEASSSSGGGLHNAWLCDTRKEPRAVDYAFGQDGLLPPVLKHGPRSLPNVRVFW